jgi:hypothetical protein
MPIELSLVVVVVEAAAAAALVAVNMRLPHVHLVLPWSLLVGWQIASAVRLADIVSYLLCRQDHILSSNPPLQHLHLAES